MCEADKTAHPAGFSVVLLFASAELYLQPAELTFYIRGLCKLTSVGSGGKTRGAADALI